jgi:lipoyl(octanoyl) transferase
MSSTATAATQTLDWGRTGYADAYARQEELVARRNAGEVGDTLVFTEHDPVYTLGVRKGAEQHMIWDEAELARRGIAVFKSNRGGDITYHGPGQIVGYPIINLAARKDLHAYLRLLEQVLINTVGTFGLAAARREGKTGIWLGPRKIAAIGVAVKKWTTYHGFALNVSPDLAPFSGIVPCGITDGTVTSMAAELGQAPDQAEVKRVLASEFWQLLPRFLETTNPHSLTTNTQNH